MGELWVWCEGDRGKSGEEGGGKVWCGALPGAGGGV